MMNKDEAVNKIATEGRLSMSRAEDLYDSFFEKPVVPQYVADWYEENKEDFDYNLWDYLTSWEQQKGDDFKEWINNNNTFQTLVNMHQFGYEVEKEPRYTVRIKGVDEYASYLNKNLDNHEWFFASNDEIKGYRINHTRKELEANGFGWVFDCPGVEVKEVDDGND